jgi:hypothetical protein
MELHQAEAQPVIAFVPPGPDVTKHIPKPLNCAYASAANDAVGISNQIVSNHVLCFMLRA